MKSDPAKNREAQRRFGERRAQEGVAPVTIWLPVKRTVIADFKQAAERVCAEPHLTVRLVSTITGRAVSRPVG